MYRGKPREQVKGCKLWLMEVVSYARFNRPKKVYKLTYAGECF
jgi:hypothetical protein